jgi:FAD/FMN-containing dehydrogenase/Fe-S oxidoreductase
VDNARHALLEIAREARGDVRADAATRELYAVDASLYRRVPVGAMLAGHSDDLSLAVDACTRHGIPLTMRGAGTSLAGQAVGRGLVVDCSRLCDIEVDPGSMTARVGPGAVLDDLNRAAAAHGLMFGPDVATGSRATLGGMIGNNSAGARSIVHGMTADNLVELDVVLADGTRASLRRGGPAPAALEAARAVATDAGFPELMRRVSGYALDRLVGPEPDWPAFLSGSEGTLAVLRQAVVRLVRIPPERALAIVPFAHVDAALEAVPGLLDTGPSAIELMDAALVDPANRQPAERALLGLVGRAPAMLVVEYSGEAGQAAERARALAGATVITDPRDQAAVWTIRRTGIARALRTEGDDKPIPFIEDPAVPPDQLAAFAREVRRLLADEGMGDAVWYGHASVGCLHIRPMVDLRQPGAVARVRRVAEGVADLVAAHDGSLSGEHGDGRLRGELLPRMYDGDLLQRFAQAKRALDPQGILNPGIIIDPEPLDAGLRIQASPPPRRIDTAVSFDAVGGLQRAAEACNGNGQCRRSDAVMCPSYQALRDERHSTRGRAVLLRAAIDGHLDLGLADPGLAEALDLCLSCRACATECPAGVDMSRLKVEALVHRHAERRPPPSVLAAAHAHDMMRAGSVSPRMAGALARRAERQSGRPVPRPTRPWRPPPPTGDGTAMGLFGDTWTRFRDTGVGDAAVRVLATAGARVHPLQGGCCGRPALSQGMPDLARSQGRRALRTLAPMAMAGHPIVVLEPSCLSMLESDLPWLLPDDPRAGWVADAVTSFEQAVLDLGLEVPGVSGAPLVHRHCHSRADGDTAAVAALGPGATATDAGCCGMAGAFGYQHPEVSRLIGEDRLAPQVRASSAPVVAAGVSCRDQIADLTGRDAVHPAVHLDHLLHE